MRAWLVLAIVGCGGGPSVVPPEPAVRLTSRQCSIQSGGFLIADLDYQVTMAVDQAFEATVGTSLGQQGDSSFSCGSWTPSFVGGENRGCERTGDFDSDSEMIHHQFTTSLPATPVQFSVSVLGSVVEAPGSNVMFANAGEVVDCDVPPSP
jgi:hypothetical protein